MRYHSLREAGWQSGHAAVCNTVYAGSIPTPASRTEKGLARGLLFIYFPACLLLIYKDPHLILAHSLVMGARSPEAYQAQHESEHYEGVCFRVESFNRVIKIFSIQRPSSKLSMNASSSFRTRDAALFFSLFSIRVTVALDAPSSLANSRIILSSSGWILSSVAAS